jgi:hypothetical protein
MHQLNGSFDSAITEERDDPSGGNFTERMLRVQR